MVIQQGDCVLRQDSSKYSFNVFAADPEILFERARDYSRRTVSEFHHDQRRELFLLQVLGHGAVIDVAVFQSLQPHFISRTAHMNLLESMANPLQERKWLKAAFVSPIYIDTNVNIFGIGMFQNVPPLARILRQLRRMVMNPQ